jgi:hypothetical protein
MAAVLEAMREFRQTGYQEARRFASERLRARESRLACRFGLTPEQWREITHRDWPEIAGCWEELRPAQPERGDDRNETR